MVTTKHVKIFAYGTENDPLAWQVADRLREEFPGLEFVKTDRPDDIALSKGMENVIIMDAASGISHPTILTIDDLVERGAVTAHDIDLGMTLKLLEKTGKIDPKKVRIIGLPKDSRPGKELLERVARILRELNVQEMGGA